MSTFMGLDAAQLRAWGRRHGIPCAKTGPLPLALLDAYTAAHQTPQEPPGTTSDPSAASEPPQKPPDAPRRVLTPDEHAWRTYARIAAGCEVESDKKLAALVLAAHDHHHPGPPRFCEPQCAAADHIMGKGAS